MISYSYRRGIKNWLVHLLFYYMRGMFVQSADYRFKKKYIISDLVES